MNNEGQNVVPEAPQTPPAAPFVSPEQPTTPTSQNGQDDYIVIGDGAARAQKSKKRKIIIVVSVIGILAVVIAIITLIVSLTSGNITISKTNDATPQSIIDTAREKLNQTDDSMDVPAMGTYMSTVLDSYENGTGYQQLSKEEIAKVYQDYAKLLASIVGNYSEYREQYIPILLSCYHKADDILQTADSAVDVYSAEISFGSDEEAQKYKQIAIDRGSKAFEPVEWGQG